MSKLKIQPLFEPSSMIYFFEGQPKILYITKYKSCRMLNRILSDGVKMSRLERNLTRRRLEHTTKSSLFKGPEPPSKPFLDVVGLLWRWGGNPPRTLEILVSKKESVSVNLMESGYKFDKDDEKLHFEIMKKRRPSKDGETY